MGDLPALFAKLKVFSEIFTEDEIKTVLEEQEQSKDMSEEIDFESFLRVSLWKMLLLESYISCNL